MSTSHRKSTAAQKRESLPTRIQPADPDPSQEGAKILLQPRLCTLRSYGSNSAREGVVLEDPSASTFFASLEDYVENSRTSQDFETISGRLALVFVGALGVELVTGDSLFKKLELGEIAGAAGVCLMVVACATAFAWATRERASIRRLFSLSCNSFVDTLIDNLVEGLFFDTDPSDWSDDLK